MNQSVDINNHAITFLSFGGKERHSTQGNLLDALQLFERRFVVDNHIKWKILSESTENANTAFILGTTMDNENVRIRSLVENRTGVPIIRANVFRFGWKSPTFDDLLIEEHTPMLVIARLDMHARAVMNMDGLRNFEASGRKANWDTSDSIADEKRRVLELLGIQDVDEIERILNPNAKQEELRAMIERERGKCFKDFWKSNDVVRWGFTLSLLSGPHVAETRSDFAKPLYPNLFGDCHLIQNALFLNAGVLSRDKGAKKLARICGVECLNEP
jgi:hypothetical protein